MPASSQARGKAEEFAANRAPHRRVEVSECGRGPCLCDIEVEGHRVRGDGATGATTNARETFVLYKETVTFAEA